MPASKKSIVTKPKVMKVAQKFKGVNPKGIAKVSGSQLKSFLDFIRTQGVVGLAVGLVLGGAVSVLVKSLIDNVVMPPLGFLLGSAQGIIGLTWTLGKTSAGVPVVLHYGTFLNDFINFVVIAFVIYFIIHLLRFDKIDKKKE